MSALPYQKLHFPESAVKAIAEGMNLISFPCTGNQRVNMSCRNAAPALLLLQTPSSNRRGVVSSCTCHTKLCPHSKSSALHQDLLFTSNHAISFELKRSFITAFPHNPSVATAHGKVLLAGDALGKSCYANVQWQRQGMKRTNAWSKMPAGEGTP